ADRIFQVIELSILRLFLSYLKIRKHRPVPRTPIYDPRSAVYPPLFIKPDKNLAHCDRKALVHRESLTAPIDRDPFAPHLARDLTAVLFLPFPDLFRKGLSPDILRRLVLVFFQLPRHHQLRRDARRSEEHTSELQSRE